jgi:hypothetical protein
MNRRELIRRLRRLGGPPPAPPPGLLERLRADIPAELPGRRLAARRPGPVRRWTIPLRVAAAVVMTAGAGGLAWLLRDEIGRPARPAAPVAAPAPEREAKAAAPVAAGGRLVAMARAAAEGAPAAATPAASAAAPELPDAVPEPPPPEVPRPRARREGAAAAVSPAPPHAPRAPDGGTGAPGARQESERVVAGEAPAGAAAGVVAGEAHRRAPDAGGRDDVAGAEEPRPAPAASPRAPAAPEGAAAAGRELAPTQPVEVDERLAEDAPARRPPADDLGFVDRQRLEESRRQAEELRRVRPEPPPAAAGALASPEAQASRSTAASPGAPDAGESAPEPALRVAPGGRGGSALATLRGALAAGRLPRPGAVTAVDLAAELAPPPALGAVGGAPPVLTVVARLPWGGAGRLVVGFCFLPGPGAAAAEAEIAFDPRRVEGVRRLGGEPATAPRRDRREVGAYLAGGRPLWLVYEVEPRRGAPAAAPLATIALRRPGERDPTVVVPGDTLVSPWESADRGLRTAAIAGELAGALGEAEPAGRLAVVARLAAELAASQPADAAAADLARLTARAAAVAGD